MTWTQTLRYCDSGPNNQDGYLVTNRQAIHSVVTLHQGRIQVLDRTEQMGTRFHHAIQNGMQFETYELFLELSM